MITAEEESLVVGGACVGDTGKDWNGFTEASHYYGTQTRLSCFNS